MVSEEIPSTIVCDAIKAGFQSWIVLGSCGLMSFELARRRNIFLLSFQSSYRPHLIHDNLSLEHGSRCCSCGYFQTNVTQIVHSLVESANTKSNTSIKKAIPSAK
jgi:hypothetical protein